MVVIYAADGRVVRALGLGQIVPEIYVEALPRTVSSLHWRGDSWLAAANRYLLVAVVVPGDDAPLGRDRATIEIRIDLATGAVTPPSGPAWDWALAQAHKGDRRAHRERSGASGRACRATRRTRHHGRRRLAPLPGEGLLPARPGVEALLSAARVLRSPSARDYPRSERWVREALAGPLQVVMLAAPAAPDRLVAVVQDAVQDLPPGRLKRTRIYLAVPPEPARLLAAALRSAGAEIVVLDPLMPIPQRPERLRGETPADAFLDKMDDPEGDAPIPG